MAEFTFDQVAIVEVDEISIAVMEHRGPPALVDRTARQFAAWRQVNGLTMDLTATYNIFADDPATASPEEFRLGIAASWSLPIAENHLGIMPGTIPAGRRAKLHYVGDETGFIEALEWLTGEWLPQSGEEPGDFPLYCQRVKFFPQVQSGKAITDLYLPLR